MEYFPPDSPLCLQNLLEAFWKGGWTGAVGDGMRGHHNEKPRRPGFLPGPTLPYSGDLNESDFNSPSACLCAA